MIRYYKMSGKWYERFLTQFPDKQESEYDQDHIYHKRSTKTTFFRFLHVLLINYKYLTYLQKNSIVQFLPINYETLWEIY